jgi:hypothetical protein
MTADSNIGDVLKQPDKHKIACFHGECEEDFATAIVSSKRYGVALVSP